MKTNYILCSLAASLFLGCTPQYQNINNIDDKQSYQKKINNVVLAYHIGKTRMAYHKENDLEKCKFRKNVVDEIASNNLSFLTNKIRKQNVEVQDFTKNTKRAIITSISDVSAKEKSKNCDIDELRLNIQLHNTDIISNNWNNLKMKSKISDFSLFNKETLILQNSKMLDIQGKSNNQIALDIKEEYNNFFNLLKKERLIDNTIYINDID